MSKRPPVRAGTLMGAATLLWLIDICWSARRHDPLLWFVVLAPAWLGAVVLVSVVVVGVLGSFLLGVVYRLKTWSFRRRQERERRLILRGLQAGFLYGRGRLHYVEPEAPWPRPGQPAHQAPGAGQIVIRGVSLPRPAQPDRTHGN